MQTALYILIILGCITLGIPILFCLLRVLFCFILLFVKLWEGK